MNFLPLNIYFISPLFLNPFSQPLLFPSLNLSMFSTRKPRDLKPNPEVVLRYDVEAPAVKDVLKCVKHVDDCFKERGVVQPVVWLMQIMFRGLAVSNVWFERSKLLSNRVLAIVHPSSSDELVTRLISGKRTQVNCRTYILTLMARAMCPYLADLELGIKPDLSEQEDDFRSLLNGIKIIPMFGSALTYRAETRISECDLHHSLYMLWRSLPHGSVVANRSEKGSGVTEYTTSANGYGMDSDSEGYRLRCDYLTFSLISPVARYDNEMIIEPMKPENILARIIETKKTDVYITQSFTELEMKMACNALKETVGARNLMRKVGVCLTIPTTMEIASLLAEYARVVAFTPIGDSSMSEMRVSWTSPSDGTRPDRQIFGTESKTREEHPWASMSSHIGIISNLKEAFMIRPEFEIETELTGQEEVGSKRSRDNEIIDGSSGKRTHQDQR